MNARAYAKINWFLQVTGSRPDGYHELIMLMQRINLYDDLHFEKTDDGQITLIDDAANPVPIPPEQNLIVRVARAFQEQAHCHEGVRIKCYKRIPAGAGLGGGSADAAATLLALNQLWGLSYTRAALQSLALPFGADIPYCLEEGPAIVRGIGESLSPVDFGVIPWLVLLKPQQSLSTKDVFSKYHQAAPHQRIDVLQTLDAIRKKSYHNLHNVCGNDLQPAAVSLMPQIHEALEYLRHNGALYAQMSGSGSAVFGVYKCQQEARQAWHLLRKSYPTCILTHGMERAISVPSGQLGV